MSGAMNVPKKTKMFSNVNSARLMTVDVIHGHLNGLCHWKIEHGEKLNHPRTLINIIQEEYIFLLLLVCWLHISLVRPQLNANDEDTLT
jgi:hypothetical protein